jgi:hypothetical protein
LEFFVYNLEVRLKTHWIFITTILLLGGFVGWQSTYAQTKEPQYFPETGHRLTGEFYNAYYNVRNPLLLFGYPITEAYLDETTGRVVQYFQRARFELHPELPAGQRVVLSDVGEYLYEPGPILPIPESGQACRYFPQTGHRICYSFLDFYNANGGVAQFGYPISDFENHNDRIVQYFQRARFEWHPEFPNGQRVTLTNLGRQYFDARKEERQRLNPVNDSNNLLPTILNLQVRAFTRSAVTSTSGSQSIFVIVQDQTNTPVPNAQVVVITSMPSGEQGRYILPLTDERGISEYTFNFKSDKLGVAKIWVVATYGNLQQQTVTSFRIWW